MWDYKGVVTANVTDIIVDCAHNDWTWIDGTKTAGIAVPPQPQYGSLPQLRLYRLRPFRIPSPIHLERDTVLSAGQTASGVYSYLVATVGNCPAAHRLTR